MGKITTKKRILFSFRGQVTINGQIMSEKPGIFCAQNGQKLWVFGQPEGGENMAVHHGGKVGKAGKTLASKTTSKSAKSKAGKTLADHKAAKH